MIDNERVNDTLNRKFRPDQNNFNLIRLVAACAVIYGHSYAVTRGGGADFVTLGLGYGFTGGLAVDAFFFISGFLVTASAMKGDAIFYAVSRALRIFPALWFHLFLVAFVLAPTIAKDTFSLAAAWDFFWLQATVQRYILFLPGVFEELPNRAVNGPLWSVLVEANLYFWTMLFAMMGLFKRKALFNGVFALVVVGSYFSPDGIVFGHGSTDRHVMLMYLIGSFFWINRDIIRLNSVGLVLCLLLAALFQGTPKFGIVYFLLLPYVVMTLATGMKIPWFDKVDYSYGTYLWGWPIQQAILLANPDMSAATNQMIAIPLALVIGALSWHLIEQPILAQKSAITGAIKAKMFWRRNSKPGLP